MWKQESKLFDASQARDRRKTFGYLEISTITFRAQTTREILEEETERHTGAPDHDGENPRLNEEVRAGEGV